jgi:hypothetical protein
MTLALPFLLIPVSGVIAALYLLVVLLRRER